MTDKITIERETLERAIADYDFAAGNDGAALSWIRARDNIIGLLRAALAAQQAEPQEPLTDSYVQQVPDKCDRIVWRNRYYSLPPAPAADKPVQPPAVPLTDEQIDDICWNFNCSNTPLVEYDRLIARAIEAAHGIAAAGDKQ